MNLRNIGKISGICQAPDKVLFSFSSYNLNDHEKSALFKGLHFAILPKIIAYSEFLLPFEMVFNECVRSRLWDNAYLLFKQVFRISDKYLSREEAKALNNLVKSKDLVIQKADKGNNIIFLNRSDYISKLSKILEDICKFKRVNIEEGKALNYLIHMEERIIRLLKSLEE